jgi:hypothetical protein
MSVQGICYIEVNSGYYSQPQIYGQEQPLILVDSRILDQPDDSTVVEVPEVPMQTVQTEDPVSTEEQPVSTEEQPVSTEEQPVSTEEQPVLTEEQPVLTEEQPVLTEEQPVSIEEQPVLTTPQGFQGFSSNVGKPLENNKNSESKEIENFELSDLKTHHYIIIIAVIILIMALAFLIIQKKNKYI